MKHKFKIREDKPPLDVQIKEAEEKGLVLLNRTDNRCYGYYKMQCGHTSFLHYGAVRKAKITDFACSECIHIKYEEEAKSIGLIYHKDIPSKGKDYRYYTLPCGHSDYFKAGNIRRGQFNCVVCETTRYEEEAKASGLTLLCSTGKQERLYLMPCGHTKIIKSLDSVRYGSFRCRVCQNETYHKEARASGVEYLEHEKSSHHDYRVYRLACGCVKEITIASVKRGTFECKTHPSREIDLTRPTVIYLVEVHSGDDIFLKLGYTIHTQIRFRDFGDVILIAKHLFENGLDAIKAEKEIHTKYKNYRIPPSILKGAIKSGHTECYPIGMKSVLLEELNKYKTEECVCG